MRTIIGFILTEGKEHNKGSGRRKALWGVYGSIGYLQKQEQ